MMSSIIDALLIAWILTWFDIDDMFIEVLQPLFKNITLTSSHFYLLFLIIGIIVAIFK